MIEYGKSGLSPEEKKRFEAVGPRKRPYEGGANNGANVGVNNGGQQGKAVTPSKNDILKLFGFAPENPAARAICYNCQKPGHYSKNCTEPKKVKADG